MNRLTSADPTFPNAETNCCTSQFNEKIKLAPLGKVVNTTVSVRCTEAWMLCVMQLPEWLQRCPMCASVSSFLPSLPPYTADQVKWTVHQIFSSHSSCCAPFQLSLPLKYGHSLVFCSFISTLTVFLVKAGVYALVGAVRRGESAEFWCPGA